MIYIEIDSILDICKNGKYIKILVQWKELDNNWENFEVVNPFFHKDKYDNLKNNLKKNSNIHNYDKIKKKINYVKYIYSIYNIIINKKVKKFGENIKNIVNKIKNKSNIYDIKNINTFFGFIVKDNKIEKHLNDSKNNITLIDNKDIESNKILMINNNIISNNNIIIPNINNDKNIGKFIGMYIKNDNVKLLFENTKLSNIKLPPIQINIEDLSDDYFINMKNIFKREILNLFNKKEDLLKELRLITNFVENQYINYKKDEIRNDFINNNNFNN